MSYIGSTPTTQSFISGTDYFNGDGSTVAFTLSRSVVSVNDIEAVINNVEQQPNTAYTVSGTTITFTSAPSAGTGNIYVRYLSTTTQSITPSQGTVSYSTLDSNMQSAISTGMKNRLINGAMVIDQRNAGASVTPSSSTYSLDRWQASMSAASKFSFQQNAGSVTPPVGFTNYLGVTSTSAYSVGSTETFLIRQPIEGFNTADLGFGTANAKTVTLSFWVQSSLTGTFGGALYNNDGTRSYPFTYTISSANTWTQISVTIAGDTSGTWVGATNGIGLYVSFSLGSGSTRSGTAGAWASAYYPSATGATSVVGTSGATFYITGVQLEVGSSATGFEYRQYTNELQLCQRYFEQSYTYGKTAGSSTDTEAVVGQAGYATSTTVVDYGSTTFFKVTKRTTPTIAFYQNNGTANIWGYAALGNYTTVGQWINTNGFGFYTTSATGATTSRTYMVYGHFTASAEL